ncbi:MAG: nitroreductase family protein [Candidatus Aminicenantes bacterium]|jgi:nitroreductase
MDKTEEQITKQEALSQIQSALRRAALLYHSFSRILIDEFGDKQGEYLIRKAIDVYGARIGEEAREAAQKNGLPPVPENFASDLPDIAWEVESVVVDGEERARVHHCPLASEWLEWSDPKIARLYCHVDQAKMKAYNPDYEYIHIKNILDGDPYCELAIRKTGDEKAAENISSEKDTKNRTVPNTVRWLYGRYTREALMAMDPACLRALFRERIHHTIEVDLYPIILGKKPMRPNIGREPELILDVWRKRGFPENEPDLEWGKTYIEMAQRLRAGKNVTLPVRSSTKFSKKGAALLKKLIWERRSIRDWIPNKEIPDGLIDQILDAGRAAPTGCNLEITRFVVIRDSEEAKMVWSDIPTPMDSCVLIVVCYDTRIYKTLGHDRLIPQNQLYDCAAAADHMCLMAHILGLGAVWLTRTEKTAQTFKEKFGLPDYLEPALHIAVGWPAIDTIKSQRMPLKEMIVNKKSSSKGED